MLHNVLQDKRNTILEIANDHGVRNIKVFGSVAKKEDGPNSDLDLLVEFEEGRSLFDLIRFKQEVEELLGVNVDVVTENAMHNSIKDDVINGAIQL